MANSDQYFKATTEAALQSAFYTTDGNGELTPLAGMNITPITKAKLATPESPKTGDGTSYYVNIRHGEIIATPAGVTSVAANEALAVTGMWS